MPKKSVSEMNAFQRLHHSLGGKTFRAIILLCLIISTAAIAFGFSLYVSSVRRDFRVRTTQMAETASALLDHDELIRQAGEVLRIWKCLTAEQQDTLGNKQAELLSRFQSVRTESFEQTRDLMRMIQEKNGAIAAYTGLLDPVSGRLIFVADSDSKASFCPPGSWDALGKRPTDELVNGKEYLLDRLYDVGRLPATFIDLHPYGYRCMAGSRVAEMDGFILFIFFDTDMNQISRVSRQYFIQYVAVALLITLLVVIASIRHLNRNTVAPINQLARAAEDYVEDRNGARQNGGIFSGLDIRTGDEIEKLSLVLKSMETDLGTYFQNLTRVTAEKERISTELTLATRIQADMLPNIYPAFPDRPEFDIYASMDPAREVGGDFYDFFLIDEDHLCIIMADVSGKGVPAALFMMATKIILDNNAMMGKSPARILADTNEAICSGNREDMFVTVWLGILEISTGQLTASSAGHEYPVLCHAGGTFQILKDRHGFVIGGMPGAHYEEYELKLEPGSRLFLYTDGLPEAENGENSMFGKERMLAALNMEPDGSPRQILQNVQRQVDAFVCEAEQFDDITMLCLEYRGSKNPVKQIRLPALRDNFPRVTEFIDAQLEEAGCPLKARMQMDVAVDEVFTNISSYAYAGGTGEATIRFEILPEPRAARISFMDSGVPYDPLQAPEPDISLSAEERKEGGLGIFLVKKIMDEVTYERANGCNILRIIKRF